MKKDIMISELELSRDVLQNIYENLGLLDDIDYVYGEFKEYGYTNILDFAIDELTNNSTLFELLDHAQEYAQSLRETVDHLWDNY